MLTAFLRFAFLRNCVSGSGLLHRPGRHRRDIREWGGGRTRHGPGGARSTGARRRWYIFVLHPLSQPPRIVISQFAPQMWSCLTPMCGPCGPGIAQSVLKTPGIECPRSSQSVFNSSKSVGTVGCPHQFVAAFTDVADIHRDHSRAQIDRIDMDAWIIPGVNRQCLRFSALVFSPFCSVRARAV